MTSVPILRGIYANGISEFVTSLPVNREPVVLDTGLSRGFLRPAPGIALLGAGPGADRGAINWNGTLYRVMGSKLCTVDANGVVTICGDVGNDQGPVTLDYGFDRLGIASAGRLFYWNGTSLSVVTDRNLGNVVDVLWIAGYYMFTDGTSIGVTDLTNPMTINPLKYGSAESDPDPIVALHKIRDEALAIGRYTIQAFQNVGGALFPFANIPSAMIQCGAVGTQAVTPYLETIAFVGSPRDQALGVFLAESGSFSKLSTREVDQALAALTEQQAAMIRVETRVDNDEQRLLVHLPDATYVFYQAASKAESGKIWTKLASGIMGDTAYMARGLVRCYGKWHLCDDQGRLGVLDPSVSTQYGDVAGYRFDTALLTNPDGRAIVKSVELCGLAGAAPFGVKPVVFHSWTIDARTWSQERAASTGVAGARATNVQWRGGKRVNSWMGLRFRGADAGMATFTGLNVVLERLA